MSVIWSGGAIATKQINTETPVVAAVAMTFSIKLEDHLGETHTITISAASGKTVAEVVTLLYNAAVAAQTGLVAPFVAVAFTDSTTHLTITAGTAGTPFTVTASATGADVSLTDANTTANSGPNIFSQAENWVGDVAPVSTESVIIPADATDNIYGENFSTVELVGFVIEAGCGIAIGARNKPLQLDSDAATLEGTGESYLKISNYGTINVNAAASAPSAGKHGLNLTGLLAAAGTININCESNQSVGIAANAGEVMEADAINIGGGSVKIGSGVVNYLNNASGTLPVVSIGGGTVEVCCAASTITKEGGELTTEGSGAITTLKNRMGKATLNSTGVIATLEKYDATVDFSKSLAARTVTTCKVLAGNKSPDDPNGVVTFTNPVEFHNNSAKGAILNLGAHRKFTVAAI